MMKTPTPPSHYNQWRALLAISQASLRSMTRSPSAVIFSIAFPLVFIVVFGFIRTNSIRLDVSFDPQTDTTINLYAELQTSSSFRFKTFTTAEEQIDQLHKGRLDAVIKVSKSSKSDTVCINITTSKASRERGRFVSAAVAAISDHRNVERFRVLNRLVTSEVLTAMQAAPPATQIFSSEVSGREYKMIDFILPGQLGFSILSAGVFGTAFVFFSLRQTLVLKRFFATPIKRSYIILGEALARLIFQLAGSIIIILIGHFVFGFTLINGLGTLLQMLFLSAIGLVVFMGFGFVVSGIARNESTIPPFANIITLPQFLLSGTFFPVDAFPNWLQKVSNILPLTYLNDALRRTAFEGAALTELFPQLTVLLVWGIVIYTLSVRLFRWE
jgi:ABC-2 type transport system permease protein